jgi:hypothetical protein
MRKTAEPLAMVLSLLMAVSLFSASVCDLKCWFHESDSCCHGLASDPGRRGDHEMAMGASHGRGVITTNAARHRHCVLTRAGTAAPHLAPVGKDGGSATLESSGFANSSPCSHVGCVQLWVSTSSVKYPWATASHPMVSQVLGTRDSHARFYQMAIKNPFPHLLASEHMKVPLRV